MRRFPGVVFATAFLFLSISFSNAIAWDEYWPGANYDPSIPTVEEYSWPRARRADYVARRGDPLF